MIGIIRIQKVSFKGQKCSLILCNPVFINGVISFGQMTDFCSTQRKNRDLRRSTSFRPVDFLPCFRTHTGIAFQRLKYWGLNRTVHELPECFIKPVLRRPRSFRVPRRVRRQAG